LETLAAAELTRRLAVFPSELLEAGVDWRTTQPIAGGFELDRDSVYFLPRFPLLDGRCYSLLFDPAVDGQGAGNPEVWTILRPALDTAPTTDILAVYPSGNQLPVNQLKLYIHFSSPMSEGWVARAVRVRRADNDQALEGVFLAMEPELWDPERRRLTLLLDPGRIKRGLAPNLAAGYPLIEGVPVIITVAADFRDAAGRSLRAGAERRYEIGPSVRVRVDPADWRCIAPAAGSTGPLTIEFDRPLDHGLLQHCLWVYDGAGRALAGGGGPGPGELSWYFQPESPWSEGQYQVVADPRLEDLAGNSLMRVFDRDLRRSEDAPSIGRQFVFDFTCTPRPSSRWPTAQRAVGPAAASQWAKWRDNP
jgi:hypothetical protein